MIKIQIGHLLTKLLKYLILMVKRQLGKSTSKCQSTLEATEKVEMEGGLHMSFQYFGDLYQKNGFSVKNFYKSQNFQFFY